LLGIGAVLGVRAVGPVATWNHTPSLPEGLYIRSFTATPAVGQIVAFPAPDSALEYARRRGGSGLPVTFLEPLAAGPGDHVCVTDHLTINGREMAPVFETDRHGIPLPRWDGCRKLGPDEWFAFAPRIPTSMDSRYYGPVQGDRIIGVFVPVWSSPWHTGLIRRGEKPLVRFQALLIVLMLPTAAMADITGRATVIDGDTLDIHGTRVRLHGIDVPESSQQCQRNGVNYRCGQQAANALDALLRATLVASYRHR
jgi:conjugative transfer signal peptidase TraF